MYLCIQLDNNYDSNNSNCDNNNSDNSNNYIYILCLNYNIYIVIL